MIARIWRGWANASNADDYYRHFTSNVAPHLKNIMGHQGAYLLRHESKGEVEFVAVSFWETMETIKAFAGPNPDAAVVEPDARAALKAFDDFARHYEVAYSSTRESR